MHRVYPEGSNKSSFYEEAIVRVLEPVTKEAKEALKKRTQQRPKIVDVLDPNANSHDDDDEDDDDQSIETAQVPNEFLDDGSTNYAQLGRDIKGWKAKYRLPLKALSIKAHFKKDVVVHMSLGKAFQIRQLVFDSVEEADNFRHFIQEELSQEEGRADMRLKATLGSVPQQSEQLTLLVEIVSAWNLLAGDFSSSDPYVRCTLNGVEKHRTKYIPKT